MFYFIILAKPPTPGVSGDPVAIESAVDFRPEPAPVLGKIRPYPES